jgi:voltage-gated potassium channel
METHADQPPIPSNQVSVPTGWDIFVLLLSVLSLINIVLVALTFRQSIANIILIVDAVLCLVFLGDFLRRLRRAPSKRGYFIDELGWLDLLGSLPAPGLRLARVFRVVRVGREVRHYGMRNLAHLATSNRAGNSLLATVFLTILVLQFGSMAILRAEDDAADGNIRTASDALWWCYVTITTVGYGDQYPVTNLGRNIGVAVLTIGVGLFGVLTGFMANLFLSPKPADDQTPADQTADLRRELAEQTADLRRELAEQTADLRLKLDELPRLIAELRAQMPSVTGSDVTDS